jgi:hypothetical protein
MHAFQITHSAIEANASPKVFRLCGKPWDTRKHPYRRQGVGVIQRQRSALVADQEVHDLLAGTFLRKVPRPLVYGVL